MLQAVSRVSHLRCVCVCVGLAVDIHNVSGLAFRVHGLALRCFCNCFVIEDLADRFSASEPRARLMEHVFPDYISVGALLPSHPLWRAAARAMGGWAPPPKLTDESVRLYHRCKALHKRASAKLLEAERTESASIPRGAR